MGVSVLISGIGKAKHTESYRNCSISVLCEWERACSLNQQSVAGSCCVADGVCR